MYNTAISYVQNNEDAEEITQDVFTTIYNKADSFKGNSKVSTWIYRITVNKALDCIEKQKRRVQYKVEIQDFHSTTFMHPGVILENKEKAKFLFSAINQLADSQKTAFILSYIEDLPRQEVADIMTLSLKAVESLLQRGKKNLKKKLIEIYPKDYN